MIEVAAPAPHRLDGILLRSELDALGIKLPDDAGLAYLPRPDGPILRLDLPEGDRTAVENAVEAHDPETLLVPVGRYTLAADGNDAVRVEWQHRADAETTIAYDVNGQAGTVDADADGIVALDVTSAQPGNIEVTIGTLTLTLTAEEV